MPLFLKFRVRSLALFGVGLFLIIACESRKVTIVPADGPKRSNTDNLQAELVPQNDYQKYYIELKTRSPRKAAFTIFRSRKTPNGWQSRNIGVLEENVTTFTDRTAHESGEYRYWLEPNRSPISIDSSVDIVIPKDCERSGKIWFHKISDCQRLFIREGAELIGHGEAPQIRVHEIIVQGKGAILRTPTLEETFELEKESEASKKFPASLAIFADAASGELVIRAKGIDQVEDDPNWSGSAPTVEVIIQNKSNFHLAIAPTLGATAKWREANRPEGIAKEDPDASLKLSYIRIGTERTFSCGSTLVGKEGKGLFRQAGKATDWNNWGYPYLFINFKHNFMLTLGDAEYKSVLAVLTMPVSRHFNHCVIKGSGFDFKTADGERFFLEPQSLDTPKLRQSPFAKLIAADRALEQLEKALLNERIPVGFAIKAENVLDFDAAQLSLLGKLTLEPIRIREFLKKQNLVSIGLSNLKSPVLIKRGHTLLVPVGLSDSIEAILEKIADGKPLNETNEKLDFDESFSWDNVIHDPLDPSPAGGAAAKSFYEDPIKK